MKRFCCLLICAGACITTAIGAEREPPPLDVGALLPLLRKHRVAEPPADAKLVLFHTHTTTLVGSSSDSRDPVIYTPGFLIAEKPDGSVIVMQGTEQFRVERAKKSQPLTRPFSLAQPKPRLGGYLADFASPTCFITALQLASHGDIENADALWRTFTQASNLWMPGRSYDASYQRTLLGTDIFAHLLASARDAKAAWTDVRDGMKACLADFPSIRRADSQPDSPEAIFESINLAVEARCAPRGSVEDLLVQWSHSRLGFGCQSLWDADNAETNKHLGLARQIVLRGYDAIPELHRLSKDKRFTTQEATGFMMQQAKPVLLGDLADNLLAELLGSLNDGNGLTEPDALVAAAFDRKGWSIKSLHETPLRILAAKYPDRLLPLCFEFQSHAPDDLQPYPLAEAIASSSLPLPARIDALEKFAQKGSLEHKRCILQNLAKINGTTCARLLVPILQRLPKDSSGPYWTCPEAAFTHVVMELSDLEVWKTYLIAARRATPGLRMEMMNAMDYSYIGEKNRDLRLAFLSAFLQDNALRDVTKHKDKFDGPCAAFTIPKITVRNFAAWQMAAVLHIDEQPDSYWTASDWTRLSEAVTKRIKSMHLPVLAN